MTRNRIIGLVATALLLSVVAVGLVFLAPLQVGGRTAYVITTGVSMEPTFHDGDLVLTRTQDAYEVGDIVLYHAAELDRNVLHRIVAVDGERFVLQGDNNGYRDPEHPTADQIRGVAWVLLPGAGRTLEWLRHPLALAAIAFIVVFGLLAGGREVTRRRRPAKDEPEPVRVQSVEPMESVAAPRSVLTGALVAFALFAAVAFVAFGRPTTTTAEIADAWTHTGTFSYEASVPPSTVYPDGTVTTGDTVFTELVRKLRVAFDYSFAAQEASDVRGGIGLEAVISDGQGWTRPFRIRAEQPFSGAAARVEGVLDLAMVRATVERMKELTGSNTTAFELTIVPNVALAGYAGSELIDEAYRPGLVLELDEVSLRPAASSDGESPTLEVTESGIATVQQPASIGFALTSLSVASARSLALLGLVVSVLVAGAAAGLLARRDRQGESGRIQARYGSRVVRAEAEIPEGRWVTDVRTIDELARIAEHYDRVILRVAAPAGETYIVDDGVSVYRYVPSARPAAPRPARPVRSR